MLKYGEAGGGKTMEALSHDDPIGVIDIEEKADICHDDFYEDKHIEVFHCWRIVLDDDGKIIDDGIRTLKAVDEAIVNISKNMRPTYPDANTNTITKYNRVIYEPLTDKDGNPAVYKSVVLDGAQKIYAFVESEYLGKTGRKKIYGVQAFTAVNKRLKKIFDPIVALGRFFGKNIIINAGKKAKYEPTGEIDKYSGDMKTQQTGYMYAVKEFVAHAVDIVVYMRVIETAKGKQRISSFDKHAIVGDIDMNIGFVDLIAKDLKMIHYILKKNRKERKKIIKNPRYAPNAKIMAIERIFEKDGRSFKLSDLKNMMSCIHCGAFLPFKFEICPRCAKPQERTAIGTDST